MSISSLKEPQTKYCIYLDLDSKKGLLSDEDDNCSKFQNENVALLITRFLTQEQITKAIETYILENVKRKVDFRLTLVQGKEIKTFGYAYLYSPDVPFISMLTGIKITPDTTVSWVSPWDTQRIEKLKPKNYDEMLQKWIASVMLADGLSDNEYKEFIPYKYINIAENLYFHEGPEKPKDILDAMASEGCSQPILKTSTKKIPFKKISYGQEQKKMFQEELQDKKWKYTSEKHQKMLSSFGKEHDGFQIEAWSLRSKNPYWDDAWPIENRPSFDTLVGHNCRCSEKDVKDFFSVFNTSKDRKWPIVKKEGTSVYISFDPERTDAFFALLLNKRALIGKQMCFFAFKDR